MDYEAEQLECYRILKSNRIVNENITAAIENAQRAAKECRQEILDIVSFIGEKDHPELHEIRIKLAGFTEEEQ
jgi:hypothetical protein